MLDLSQIFPINYPDVPTHEDIEFMFKEILNHSDSVNQVVREIEKETCPYYKEALIHCLAAKLDDWYDKQKEIAGIDYGDCWIHLGKNPKTKSANSSISINPSKSSLHTNRYRHLRWYPQTVQTSALFR